VRTLRYSRKWGVFTIGIAVALAEHGLEVVFHTDVDDDIQPLELMLYKRARRLGVPIRPAISLSRLKETIADGAVPIVFYSAGDGEGHFSPVVEVTSGRIVLPNDRSGGMSVNQFRRAWRAPGFPRQVVIADRPPGTRLHRTAARGKSAGRPPVSRK
jgi:hypothetical protein